MLSVQGEEKWNKEYCHFPLLVPRLFSNEFCQRGVKVSLCRQSASNENVTFSYNCDQFARPRLTRWFTSVIDHLSIDLLSRSITRRKSKQAISVYTNVPSTYLEILGKYTKGIIFNSLRVSLHRIVTFVTLTWVPKLLKIYNSSLNEYTSKEVIFNLWRTTNVSSL